jgi:hypothetical protein
MSLLMNNSAYQSKNVNATSPYSERMAMLSHKISTLPIEDDASRQNNAQAILNRIQTIDAKINEVADIFAKNTAVAKDSIAKLQKRVEEEQNTREQIMEAFDRDTKTLEINLYDKLETEANLRKEADKRMCTYIEEKLTQLKQEITKCTEDREEKLSALTATLQVNNLHRQKSQSSRRLLKPKRPRELKLRRASQRIPQKKRRNQ